MALQNRVTPSGDLITTDARGTLMGNRGILHDGNRNVKKRWAHSAWIICVLEFGGRRRVPMSPGRYTELFFLDEATALAAGHRPCGECQREKQLEFKGLFEQVHGRKMKSAEMDRILHNERRIPYKRSGWKMTFSAELATLPNHTIITHNNDAYLKHNNQLLRWMPAGYEQPTTDLIPSNAHVNVLTPHSIVELLKLGYQPTTHSSASP